MVTERVFPRVLGRRALQAGATGRRALVGRGAHETAQQEQGRPSNSTAVGRGREHTHLRNRGPWRIADERSLLEAKLGVDAIYERMCSAFRGEARQGEKSDWQCAELVQMRRSLAQMGRSRVPPHRMWQPLEGSSTEDILRQNSDPLGALQRGEIPAIIVRAVLPPAKLRALLLRISGFASSFGRCLPNGSCRSGWNYACSAACNTSSASFCAECDREVEMTLSRVCALHLAAEELADTTTATLHAQWVKEVRHCARSLHSGASIKWGTKTVAGAGCFQGSAREKHTCMERTARVSSAVALLGRSSPHAHMLKLLQGLARPGQSVRAATESTGEQYAPGIVHSMRPGFRYPLHFDSKNADGWVAVRRHACNERVPLEADYTPGASKLFSPLSKHHFTTAAILTLSAPDRAANPYDLKLRRVRWPALMFNCSHVASSGAYGIGVRLDETATSNEVVLEEAAVTLRGDPGDVYLFNAEFVHDTPRILGSRGRSVLNALVGYSEDSSVVEVFS